MFHHYLSSDAGVFIRGAVVFFTDIPFLLAESCDPFFFVIFLFKCLIA